MDYKIVGTNSPRWDAIAKVKGMAEYTGDIPVRNALIGKIVRASIAHGYVKSIDTKEAQKVPGVVKILTPDDLPNVRFSTAGHPYSLNIQTRDIEDRTILSRKVHQYGEDIAAVVAENEIAALQAIEKIKIEYEELPFYLTPEESTAPDAVAIHDEHPNNVIADTLATVGDPKKGFEEADFILEDAYSTQVVQHAHMENQIAYAYQDADQRWVCVSSTQIPHIARRIIGQALDIPWGRVRVIKPFIGGGFGNKQDVTIEPLVVAMSMACGGRPVKIDFSREESIAYTRVRHAISYKIKMGCKKDGTLTAMDVACLSNNGAYASHGHAIAAKGGGFIVGLYNIPNVNYAAKTVYTNIAPAGAMRGYGIPQVMFAVESMMDQAAKKLDMDPIELRRKNMVAKGALNPLNHIYQFTNGLDACLIKGREAFEWDKKKQQAAKQEDAEFRRGVGVATFSYGSGVYPKGEEIAGCRLVLNQDGSVKLMVGSTEIGQGSDTVFCQMAAETIGIPYEMVYADAKTDTDIAPFDPGTFASRLSYVTGRAVKEAAQSLRKQILDAAQEFEGVASDLTDIVNGQIVYRHNGQHIIALGDLAMKTYYDWEKGKCLTAETSINCHDNSYSMGATFAEVEVDTKTGKVRVLDIMNVHDSGKILNHRLAEGQVHGGMMMAIGYALSEQLLYDTKTGKPLNNNLLDYKFPTIMDIGELGVQFVEEDDPAGPYGNKALGEPPACAPAPAIRNAILDALGIEMNHLPMNPQRIFEALQEKMTMGGSEKHV